MTTSRSAPSTPPRTAPIMTPLLLPPELDVDEVVGDGTRVGGELETGKDGDGKNEDVAL